MSQFSLRAFASLAPSGRLPRSTAALRASTALAACLALGVPQAGLSQTWDGATSTDWTLGTNWNPNGAPGAADTATIDGAGGTNQPTLEAGDAATVAQTDVTGGALTVSGDLTSAVNVSAAGTLDVTGTGTIAGSVVTSGTTTNAGTIASVVHDGGTFGNDGTISGALSVLDDGFTNGAGGQVNGNVSVSNSGTTLVNDGTLGNAAADTVSVATNTELSNGAGATIAGTITTSGLVTNSGTISAGVTIDDGTFAGNAGGDVQGSVTVNGSGTYDVNASDTISGLNGNGTVQLDATLTTGSAANNSFSGTTAGAGGITVQGTGETTLAGIGTHTGQTTVNSGTLTVVNGGAIANSGAVVVNGGTFSVLESEEIGSLAGGVGGTVDVRSVFGDIALTIGGAASTTFAGTVTNSSGSDTGRLVKDGTGTLTLSGPVTGAGLALTVTQGTLALSGANTFGGGVVVDEGRLRLLSNGAAGGAAGQITTTGSVISYGNGVTMATPITLGSDDTQLEVLGADAATQSGAIGETGGARPLEKIGTGTLTLTGANTYTGTTTVSAGTLVLNNGAGTGAIADTGAITTVAGTTLDVQADETVGSVTGAGLVTLNGDLTLAQGASAIGGVISGAGELTVGLGVGGTSTTTLTATNTFTGGTRVNAGSSLTVTASGAIGGLTNAGTTTNAGTVGTVGNTGGFGNSGTAGDVTNTLTGSGSNTGVIASLTHGSTGTFATSGTVSGNVVQSAGVIDNSGTVGGTVAVSVGTFNNDASGDVAGATTISGTGTVDSEGELAAVTVQSGGTLRAAGTMTGALVNQAGGVATLDGDLAFAGAAAADRNVTNGGALSVTGVGTDVTGVNALTNQPSGTFGMASGTSLTAVTALNQGSAVAPTGTMTLAGTLTATSGLPGGFTNDQFGMVNAQGGLNANVTNQGMFNVTGGLTASGVNRAFANLGSGVLNVTGGSYTGLGTVTNAGIVNIGTTRTLGALGFGNSGQTNLSGTIEAPVTNSGTIAVIGTGAIVGNTSNTGTVDLDTVGSGTADRLNITGDLAGNGTFRVRSDVTQAVGSNDRIAVSGTATGNYVLQFSNVGGAVLGNDLTIFSAGTDGGYTFVVNGLTGGGAVVTTVEKVGNDLVQVRQASSGIGGIAAGTTLTQSLIGTVVNRPTSPFVSGLASEETCSQGGYARATGGIATVEGSSNNGIATTQSSVEARYGGFQAGYDFGCNGGRYGGWDANFGALVGYNFGSTDQDVFGSATPGLVTSITKTDFDQTYIGLYAAASKDRVSGDVQLRFDRTEYELDEDLVGGAGLGLGASLGDPADLIDNGYSTNSTTISSRVNYQFTLNDDGLSFVPSAGFAYTKTQGATLTFDGGETLRIGESESVIGFIGGTLAKTVVSDAGDAGTTYFASGNYYNDFAGDRTSVFTDTASTETEIKTEGLGGFGEASIGVNFVKILENGPGGAKQLNANLRADARFGSNVKDSYSLTAQVRFSF